MRHIPQPPAPPEGENELVIFQELMAARAANRPVSRQMLSQKLHEARGLPPKQAFALVEMYCETEAPSTPEYLGSEFMIPYLKMSAFLMAAISLGLMWYSVGQIRLGKPAWDWGMIAGVLFLCLSASGWIKSIFKERSKD